MMLSGHREEALAMLSGGIGAKSPKNRQQYNITTLMGASPDTAQIRRLYLALFR